MRQNYGVTKTIASITTSVPTGAVGLELGFMGTMKTAKFLLAVTIAGEAETVALWGQRPDLDTDDTDDHTNGVWGLHNDKHGRFIAGELAPSAGTLAVGVHHFILEDVGAYVGIQLQAGGHGGGTATVTATLTEIRESNRPG